MKRHSRKSSGMTDDSTDDSDSVTLSSTSEDLCSQDEWTVEKILAQAKVGGVQKYLIEWAGYQLSEATWEPAENLSEELLTEWQAAVKETGRTTFSGFKISNWRKAVDADIRAQYAKHEARNKKRALLGLKQKMIPWSLQEWLDSVQGPSDDDEHDRPAKNDGLAKTSRGEQNLGTGSAGRRPSQQTSDIHQQEAHVSRTSNNLRGLGGESASLRKKFRRTADTSVSCKETSNRSTTLASSMSENHRSSNSGAARSAKDLPKKSLSNAPTNSKAGNVDPGSTLNVFVGGKKRKARRSLVDAVSSSGEAPKLFNYRKRWIVEKARRDKEGTRPPTQAGASLALMPIRGNTGLEASKAVLDEEKHDEMLEATDQSPLTEPSGPKKKKVRWADGPEHEQQDSIEDSESLFVPDPFESDGLLEAPGGLKSESSSPTKRHQGVALGNSSSFDETAPSPLSVSGSTSKVCQFGPKPEISARLRFSGWRTDDKSSWSYHLQNQPHLLFSHLCTMQDLRSQTGNRRPEDVTVCQGDIEPDDESETSVEAIAKRLQVGQLAVVCLLHDISIVIHVPEASSEANSLSSNSHPDGESVLLRYFIFLPDPPVSQSMLAPLPPVANQEGGLGAYKFFLGGTFERLFKNGTTCETAQNFFLVFPEGAYQEAVMVSQWIRESNSSCIIKTSLVPGQWSEFVLLDKGNVILHEDAIWVIRSMPQLGSILHVGKMNFWTFSRSSLPSTANPLVPGPTNYRLRQILRSGTVILVTPSFLVSQPEQAYNFIKFFWKNFTSHSPIFRLGKLAVAADMPCWLAELAVEKAESRAQFGMSEASENKRAKASEALRKFLMLLRQLVDETEDDEDSPLIYAPEMLDGNDEQSLVNWFGSWTVCQNYQFRKFFVLGSSNQSEARLSRYLQPVEFASAAEEKDDVSCHNMSINGPMGPLQPRNTFSSDVTRIREALIDIEKGYKSLSFVNPIVLYRFPIVQKKPDNAQQMDSGIGPEDLTRWFTFFAEPFFGRVHQLKTKTYLAPSKNTFVGVFYTISHEQSPDFETAPQQITWSPWVAIYRPSEILSRPWRSMDLLIWDHHLINRVPESEEVYEKDLLKPQQQLINLIQEKTRDTESALPLGKVWLGQFGKHPDARRENELDHALRWINELPTTIKHNLPIAKHFLPGRGWKPVTPGSRPATKLSASSMNAQSSSAKALPVRVILPPPGAIVTSEQAGPYQNYFRDAILGHRGPGPVPFTFQPTLKWYTPQLVAGLGFKHIIVSPWQSIFERYVIDDPEKE